MAKIKAANPVGEPAGDEIMRVIRSSIKNRLI
jgi:hypothetical protein